MSGQFGSGAIYHGGASAKRGFPAGSGSSGPNPDTIRMVLEEKSWHEANSQAATALLHTTSNDGLYGYKTYDFDKGDGAFATFALPHKQWPHILTGTTGINLDFFFYTEAAVAAPNNIGYFNTNAYIMRPGESVNFAKGGGQFMSLDCSVAAQQLIGYRFTDYQISDPAASGTGGWCMIYLKLRREYTGDTYTGGQIRLVGAVMEFPIT